MAWLYALSRTALALAFVAFAFTSDIYGQQVIVLNTSNAPPNSTSDDRGIGDQVLTEAFRRIGITLKIDHLPSERALLNADDGVEDGNFARVEGMEKTYRNLVRVPEEISRFEFVAFSRRYSFKIAGWDSLRPYNIGIVTGWKILETNIAGTSSLASIRDAQLLFRMLLDDKVDVVVYDRMQGLVLLRDLKISSIHVLWPPLAVKGMYLYMNRRHLELVPRIAGAIRGMKKDGTYRKITDEVLKRYGVKLTRD
ncbi:MAG: transporter substrate-binding domain-containing protein [Nitrospirae bacterium]|nr:transporter substrate-binding domain-containing protein [Nitrospirota bacterium]